MRRVLIGCTGLALLAVACSGGDLELSTEPSVAVPTTEPTALSDPEPTTGPEQEATPPPATGEGVEAAPGGTYGSDPILDGLYDACSAGDMDSCDTLFADSPVDSDYEAFGGSCGGQYEEVVTQYCGSGPSADVPPEMLAIESDQWLDGYTVEIEGNFLDGCLANAGDSQQDFCQCTWNSLATTVPFTEFVQFDNDTTQMTPAIESALAVCGF